MPNQNPGEETKITLKKVRGMPIMGVQNILMHGIPRQNVENYK